MKYYLIAGEASGDLHGSNLLKELKVIDTGSEFRCWGGDLMKEQGAHLVKHYRELAFMGLIEVLANIRTIKANLKFCKQDLLNYNPDVLILIDYPGFNIRIAEFAHNHGIKVYYYISPKVWAWKESRVKKIKKYVDKLFTIFPFETEYFKKFGYHVDFVGNPSLDAVEQRLEKLKSFLEFKKDNQLPEKPIIGLLAGSRKQEVQRCLPEMLEIIQYYPDYHFVLAAVNSIDLDYYNKFTEGYDLTIVFGQTYETLKYSKAAIVTSGTATLETALFDIPQVVCYKTSIISYRIGKLFVDIEFFSLVNLIMEREVVKEILQFNLQQDIKNELDNLLFNDDYRSKMLKNYQLLRNKLGGSGASKRLSKLIYQCLTDKS